VKRELFTVDSFDGEFSGSTESYAGKVKFGIVW
jgi:hypothetical protein